MKYLGTVLKTKIWVPTQHSNLNTTVPSQQSNLGTYSTLKFGYLLNAQIWVPTYSTLKFGYLLNTQIWVPTYSTLKFGYLYLLNSQIWVPTQHSNLGTCTYSTLKFVYLLNTQLFTAKNSHRWSWIAKRLGYCGVWALMHEMAWGLGRTNRLFGLDGGEGGLLDIKPSACL